MWSSVSTHPIKANDDYAQAYAAYNKSRVNFSNGLYITIAGLAGSLVTFAFLLFLSGHASISDRTITLTRLTGQKRISCCS